MRGKILPVRRRIFTLTPLLSLMLCVATVALWFADAKLYFISPDQRLKAEFHSYEFGWMGEFATTVDTVPDQGLTVGSSETPLLAIKYRRDAARFSQGIRFTDWFNKRLFIKVNVWAVATLLSILPFRWFFSRRRKSILARRRVHGLCLQCGYSLTGNTSGICPECGTADRSQQLEPPDATVCQVTK
jgi:hypothetical protein